jgi:hypothetical protein
LLSGVTLITHGFGGSVDDWITAMADAIAARSGPVSDQPRYRVEVTDPGHDGGPLSVVNTGRSGPSAASYAGATDIVILLNWSDVAGSLMLGGGYHRSTIDVAAAVAEKLLSPSFLTDLATPLAELPFHLIGHSRGASLVGELAKKLGEQGVWIDQATTFDPHPVDGVREPWLFNYNFGDAPMTSWNNVSFWDNYWRTEGSSALDFTGESVANVHDVQLSESVLTGGYSYEHSDVHLWYHGTIDLSPTANDGTYAVPASWYGGTQPARNTSGFYYSSLVGGTRAADGLSVELGGTAHRTAINYSNAKWPNVLQLGVVGASLTFDVGDPIPLTYYYEDYDSAAAISFSLDADQNPYSQNSVGTWGQNVAATGAAPVLSGASLGTSGIPNGTYYVAAKITDPAGHTRYAYSALPVTIVSPQPATRIWDGGGTDNKWSTAANWAGDVAPKAGDNLVFPLTAAQQSNVNDDPVEMAFGSITVSGGSYDIQNNPVRSSTVAVRGSGVLNAASIICSTLTIETGSGAPADKNVSYTAVWPDCPPTVDLPATRDAGGATRFAVLSDPETIDVPLESLSLTPRDPTPETATAAHLPIDRVFAPQVSASQVSYWHQAHPILALGVSDSLKQGFTTFCDLVEKMSGLGYEQSADPLTRKSPHSLPLTDDRRIRVLAFESLANENCLIDSGDPRLPSGARFREQDALNQNAVPDLSAELPMAIAGWRTAGLRRRA